MSGQVLGVRRWVAAAALVFALLAGGLLGIAVMSWSGQRVLGAATVPIFTARDAKAVNVGALANGFAAIVKPDLPTVVNISTSKIVKPSANASDPFNDPFFRQFFGDQFGQMFRQRPEREKSLGSGVIVSPDGYILTNNHVVNGASDIKVFLSDQREYTAKVVGTDPKTDIAVLKINASGLPAMTLGDSSQIEIGDIVLAIGDPLGIGETVTMGIVSAKGRGGLGIETYEDFIQTDAAINPGNSGGALINARGECIGINTAILSGSGGNQGIGFAIPVNMARGVMDQILKHGKVIRGYLGVTIQNVTPEIAQAFGLSQGGGALVGSVTPDSPAAHAGIEKGDIILELNGQPIHSGSELQVRVSQTAPGTDVRLKIFREGKSREAAVKLGELPEKMSEAAPGETGSQALEGVQVEDLTPELARQLELSPQTHGVVVTAVDPASAAAEAGLSRGDVIQEVNRKPVANQGQFEHALMQAGRKPVLLLVSRGGTTIYIVVQPR